MTTCKLCKSHLADKLNSHIIPKFMCKRLFENVTPRHSVQLSKDGILTKLQDIPKEDNILCKACEKRMEILETYFSRVFIEINSLQNAVRKYEITKIGNQEILECLDITPSLFYLFIYSMIWRCSISNHLLYDTFIIDDKIEEELRKFLNNNLSITHSQLLDQAKNIIEVPRYYICVVKPKLKTRGIFTAYSFAENSYAIYTVDYAFFFYSKEKDCLDAHKLTGNNKNEIFKIVLGDDYDWRNLNNLVIENMRNYKNGR